VLQKQALKIPETGAPAQTPFLEFSGILKTPFWATWEAKGY